MHTKQNPRQEMKSKGFTPFELAGVILVFGFVAIFFAGVNELCSCATPGEANRAKAKVDISAIETALKMYKLHNGFYPSAEQGLLALIEMPATGQIPENWREGGYLEKGKKPKDPWGNDYAYLCPGLHGELDIISYGADGLPEGEGYNKDINNWEIE